MAPQRQQVIDLQRDELEQTQTLAEFLQRQIMPPGAVVIVDEAGRIGGGQMLELLELVTSRNGRIILSGDTRQHGPVEASDALRAIELYSGLRAAELKAIRRQDPSRATTERERARITGYRDAVKAAAEGDVANSFARLEAIDAVVESSPEDLRTKIVQAYVDLSERGDSALVVSQTRADVSVLNESIREALRTCGSIPKQEQSIVTLEAQDLTDAQKLDPRYYPANHVLVFNRELVSRAAGCAQIDSDGSAQEGLCLTPSTCKQQAGQASFAGLDTLVPETRAGETEKRTRSRTSLPIRRVAKPVDGTERRDFHRHVSSNLPARQEPNRIIRQQH